MQLQRLVSLRIIWYSRYSLIIMIWFNTFDHLIQFESILWFGFNVRNVEQKDSKRHDWSKTWGSARSRVWEMNFSVETILCCQPHGSKKTSRHGYLLLLMISNPIAESLRVRVNHSSRVVAGDDSHKSLIPLVFGTWLVLYDFHVYVQDISVIHMEVSWNGGTLNSFILRGFSMK